MAVQKMKKSSREACSPSPPAIGGRFAMPTSSRSFWTPRRGDRRTTRVAPGPWARGLEDANPGAVHERRAGYVDDDAVLVVGVAAEGPDGRLLRIQIELSLEIQDAVRSQVAANACMECPRYAVIRLRGTNRPAPVVPRHDPWSTRTLPRCKTTSGRPRTETPS